VFWREERRVCVCVREREREEMALAAETVTEVVMVIPGALERRESFAKER
jgi:hypothetical protein